jgi:HTH-type transcriptional regulator/antitoxin HigA
LVKFVSDSEEIPKDIALVNVLIDQYKLTLSDLPEIGDKSTVSRFLNGKRALTKVAIVNLCQRFNLRPDLLVSY